MNPRVGQATCSSRRWRQRMASSARQGSAAPRGLKPAVNLGTMLYAVDPNNPLGVIRPVENAVVAHAQLAQASQILWHPYEASMHEGPGIFSQPLNLTFDAHANGRVESGELRVGLDAYFDFVRRHAKWRGFQGLNLPARS